MIIEIVEDKLNIKLVAMVIECCVPYCKTKSTSGFHNFPANKEMRLMWLKAIQVFHFEDDALSNSFRKICKNHFRACDYQTHASGVVRLKYNSVPSQNLPNPLWMEHSYVNRQQIIVSRMSFPTQTHLI